MPNQTRPPFPHVRVERPRRRPRRPAARAGRTAGVTALALGLVLLAGACASGSVTTGASSGSVPASDAPAGSATSVPASTTVGSGPVRPSGTYLPGTHPRSLNQFMDALGFPGSVRDCVAAKARANAALGAYVDQEETLEPAQFALFRELVPECIDRASFARILAASARMVPMSVEDPPEAVACREAAIAALPDAEFDRIFDGDGATIARLLPIFDGCRQDRVTPTTVS